MTVKGTSILLLKQRHFTAEYAEEDMFLVYNQNPYHDCKEQNKRFLSACLSGYNTRIRRPSVASEPACPVQ